MNQAEKIKGDHCKEREKCVRLTEYWRIKTRLRQHTHAQYRIEHVCKFYLQKHCSIKSDK